MGAWNGWYHVVCNTYGTWLPGDPRGWREKDHKKHVPGDYKNPPPKGFGTELHKYSKGALKQNPVFLTPKQREIAGRAMVDSFVLHDREVIALSVGRIHFHLLGRFEAPLVRKDVGLAKLNAYHRLREAGHQGKVWQREAGVTPIADRRHQERVFDYIRKHANKGAWVWTFRDGICRR